MSGVRRVTILPRWCCVMISNGEMVFEAIDGFRLLMRRMRALLYLVAGVVGVVEYPEFGVSALAVQVERSVLASGEVDSPTAGAGLSGKVPRGLLFDGLRVAQPSPATMNCRGYVCRSRQRCRSVTDATFLPARGGGFSKVL